MTTLREAAQQALEALEQSETTVRYEGFGLAHREAERKHQAAIATLRAALAQQAEPCPNCASLEAQNDELDRKLAELEQADLSRCPQCGGPADNGHDRSIPPNPYFCSKCTAELSKPLYTTPSQRQPLSGLEVERLLEQVIGSLPAARNLVRAVERAHGIIESEIKVDSRQTLDDAMQQPRAMAQAYESGYKAGVAHEREACAKVCEAIDEGIRDHEDVAACAAAIRARGNT